MDAIMNFFKPKNNVAGINKPKNNQAIGNVAPETPTSYGGGRRRYRKASRKGSRKAHRKGSRKAHRKSSRRTRRR